MSQPKINRKELIESNYQTMITLSDQTVVHRKKFEFALTIIRRFMTVFQENTKESSLIDTDECADEVIQFFTDIIKILNQNLIQTWTFSTINNPPQFILEQLQNNIQSFSENMRKYGEDLYNSLNVDVSEWEQYNILDLRAISASFSQYLRTSKINDQLRKKILTLLNTINEYLQNKDGKVIPIAISPIPVHYQSWIVDYDDFEQGKEIGHGTSAKVYKGLYKKTHEDVAIKKFQFPNLNSAHFQSYQREVAVLATAQHPTLLKLIGTTDKPPFCIITEWMSGGSLFHAIHRPGYYDMTQRTIAAIDIARGMRYLHSRKIAHRDLKTLNVLLDDRKYVKICDFGFSRFAESDTTLTTTVGTPHWMAPEVLIKGSHYTSKVDVYAFGVVLWELFTSEVPYSGLDPAQIVIKVIYEDLRPAMPTSLNPQMKDLIMQCWDRNPDVRPTFDEIVRKFVEEKLMYDGADYNVVLEHIKRSQTREELVINELEILFKQLDQHKVSLDKIIEKVNKNNGLPHSIIDVAWNSLEKYNFSENERKDYAKLLVISFLKTYKAEKITEILCNFPPNSVDEETMTKIVVEVPTGSPKTDRNIVIAACKNGCADLCSLYAMNIQDIILSLEVCAMTKVDRQLNVIIGDKCVQCLSNNDINLVAAAVKCLISTDNSQRITTNSIEKLIESEKFEKIGISALISQGKKSIKVQEKLLSIICAKYNDESDYSLALVSLCSNLENANFILQNVTKNNEEFAKILLACYAHNDLKQYCRDLYQNCNFELEIKESLDKVFVKSE